jgi:hypothetical protein
MKRDARQAFEFWITQYPESHHPLDERRFYDFVDSSLDADEHIDAEWLIDRAGEYQHGLDERQLQEFGKKLEVIRDYLQDRRVV